MFSLVLVWCFGLFYKEKARLMLFVCLVWVLECFVVFDVFGFVWFDLMLFGKCILFCRRFV